MIGCVGIQIRETIFFHGHVAVCVAVALSALEYYISLTETLIQ
jgi:hypothetical protein